MTLKDTSKARYARNRRSVLKYGAISELWFYRLLSDFCFTSSLVLKHSSLYRHHFWDSLMGCSSISKSPRIFAEEKSQSRSHVAIVWFLGFYFSVKWGFAPALAGWQCRMGILPPYDRELVELILWQWKERAWQSLHASFRSSHF